jgi:hypothetical protein
MGGIFLAVLAYCFFGVALSSLLCAEKAGALSVRPLQRAVEAGRKADFVFNEIPDIAKDFTWNGKRRFPRLPGVLIRYEIDLRTRDGRRLHRLIDPRMPDDEGVEPNAPLRGAYYGSLDYFAAGDLLGLFKSRQPLPQNKEPRLLAMPGPAGDALNLEARPGGESQRQSQSFQRSDNLIDHRPYVPGDDPRRINWKLYGHTPSNELFVRQGETEPPPHSKIALLIDCLADPALYSAEAGRQGVDMLCENALALALEMEARGMDISLGWNGGKLRPGNSGNFAESLAYPAAYSKGRPETELPACPDDAALIVLALPRSLSDTALDSFLKKRKSQAVSLAFICKSGAGRAAAESAAADSVARLYNQRGGVHARVIRE